jgi:hypothetical protein
MGVSTCVVKSKELTFFFFIILLVHPLFYYNIVKRSTRRVQVTLEKDSFSVVINRMERKSQGQLLEYSLRHISSYKILFPGRRIAIILFYLRSHKTVEYSFLQKKIDSDQVDTNTLMESFHNMIRNYNDRQSEFEKISFSPSFFASRYGLYLIIGLTVLLGLVILLHVIYGFKFLPISLAIGVALIQLAAFKRKADLAFYKKIKIS